MNLSYQFLSRFLYYDREKPGKLNGTLCSPSQSPGRHCTIKRIVFTTTITTVKERQNSFIRFYANFASETFAFLLINNLYLICLEWLNYE